MSSIKPYTGVMFDPLNPESKRISNTWRIMIPVKPMYMLEKPYRSYLTAMKREYRE